MKIELTVNGLKIQAQYQNEEIENVHKPLLHMLAALQTVNPQRRTVVFLCAPPGTGKSTLTTFWEYIAQQDPELPAIQTLPMDGFHHYNSWLDAHQLRPFKGAPETFDVAKLAENLRQVVEGDCTWPQYDRQKHDPVEDALHVTAPLVIVEGNWLLLDDEKWCQLAQFCDFSIFINAPATALRERLVGRKLAGGLSLADAEDFYDRTDGPNVRRVLEESLPANLTLMMTATGEYRLVDYVPDYTIFQSHHTREMTPGKCGVMTDCYDARASLAALFQPAFKHAQPIFVKIPTRLVQQQ